MGKQTFTTGQVLTAAQMTSLQQTAMGGGSTTAKTASYVLVAADAGTVVQMNSASATTITVNTALFAAGDTVQIQNVGAGVCTVTAGTATVSTSAVLALKQYDAGSLYFNSTSAALFFAADAADGMTNPFTTTGDTVYASGGTTPTRLGIGSTGQVLTVASGIPSWATPAAGGSTLITSATFSNAATVTIDSVFTSTYKSYQVYFEVVSVSAASDDLQMQMRYGSTTQNTGVYLGSQFQYNRNNSLQTNGYVSTTTALILQSISTGGTPSLGTINFSQVGQSSQNASFYGNGLDADVQAAAVFAGLVNAGQTYTGILLKGSTANITGRYAVYGLAN
jgi:hypothetical protein